MPTTFTATKSIPPPPPPPPPPLPQSGNFSRLCPMVSQESFLCKRCSRDYGSLQSEASKICQQVFHNKAIDGEHTVLLSYYARVLPVLQEGPSCGLAALCMACQLLKPTDGSPQFLPLSYVLETAQNLGYTCRGEMFSVANMCALAKEMLSCQVTSLNGGMDPPKIAILNHLMKGLPGLVPYDADMNHEPCCRQGHKAHWAVLTGVVFGVRNAESINLDAFTQDSSLPILYHANAKPDSGTNHCPDAEDILASRGDVEIYVYGKQGKSCHVGLWDYNALALSNANLLELSPNRRGSIDHYVIPKEGVRGGLCNQLLLLGND